jgi:hypothetical protein
MTPLVPVVILMWWYALVITATALLMLNTYDRTPNARRERQRKALERLFSETGER